MSVITLYVCDTQPIVIEGLKRILHDVAEFQLIGFETSATSALPQVQSLQPKIVMLDQAGGGLKMVFRLLADIKVVAPACYPVLWVYDLPEVECFRAVQAGARGVLKKTLPIISILDCLRSVARGHIWLDQAASPVPAGAKTKPQPRLTPRERQIVSCLCRGLRNKQIAAELSITAGTVKVHLMHIFEKTGAKDRFELAVQARQLLGFEQADEVAGPDSSEDTAG